MDVLTFLWLVLTVIGSLVLGIAALMPLRSSPGHKSAFHVAPQHSPLQVKPSMLVAFLLLAALGVFGTIGFFWKIMP